MASVKPDEAEDPGMRNVRLLENRVDKAQMKYNEAAAIHKTYSLIAKRLREERIGFNNQARLYSGSKKVPPTNPQQRATCYIHRLTHTVRPACPRSCKLWSARCAPRRSISRSWSC